MDRVPGGLRPRRGGAGSALGVVRTDFVGRPGGDFISRLADFDDVEAETRAFERAASFPDFEKGLGFLMAWPALADAARMTEQRIDDVDVAPEQAELWAAKLRRRFPKAAHALLRRAAAAAFRRRDFKTCDRLSAEAETIDP